MRTDETRRWMESASRALLVGTLVAAVVAVGIACQTAGEDESSASADVDQGTTDAQDESGTTTAGDEVGCGWGEFGGLYFYACGGSGIDPSGAYPFDCPSAAMEGEDCSTAMVDGVGCCGADGSNVYCSADGVVVIQLCEPGSP